MGESPLDQGTDEVGLERVLGCGPFVPIAAAANTNYPGRPWHFPEMKIAPIGVRRSAGFSGNTTERCSRTGRERAELRQLSRPGARLHRPRA